MTVRYQRTLEQMIEAGVAYATQTTDGKRRSRVQRWFVSLFVGLMVFLGLFLIMLATNVALPSALVYMVAVFAAILSYFRHPQRVRAQLRQHYSSRQFDPSWIGETTITALPQGLHSRSPVGETLRRWNTVQVLSPTEKFLLIQIPDGLLEVPHSAFATESERHAFQEHIERCKVGMAPVTTTATVEPSAIVSTGGNWYHSKESVDATQGQRQS